MANSEHLAKLREGVKAWNQFQFDRAEEFWKTTAVSYRGPRDQDYVLRTADLSGADLRNMNLRGVWFMHVDLSGANLAGADIVGGHLQIADFTGAILSGANLGRADLSGEANLTEADLEGADLTEANLTDVELTGSNFTDARIGGTIFGRNDFSNVKGLERVDHVGPSVIGIDTIFASAGNIPEVFLRGCGVPDDSSLMPSRS
jgi:Pentapeptide repeats (8 copies)